jgi:Endodeoxyribonuclease RusA
MVRSALTTIEVVVTGINPIPWKAPEMAMGVKGGKRVPRFYKDKALDVYQHALRECIEEAYPARPIFAPGATLSIYFAFWRVLDGGVINDRRRRGRWADATNLQKSTEDSLQNCLFDNDRHNVLITTRVVQQEPDIEPMIYIRVSDVIPSELILDEIALTADFPPPTPPGNVWLVAR